MGESTEITSNTLDPDQSAAIDDELDSYLKKPEISSQISIGVDDSIAVYSWIPRAYSRPICLPSFGTFDGGVERARVRAVLATGIPEERCRRIALGY